ncbi:MAG: hypothetical protein ACK4RV_15420 [Caulobacter sp.]
MKTYLILAVGCSVLALGACESREAYRARKAQDEALKVLTKLDCPQSQGKLTLVSAAPDGKSCKYAGDDSEVELRLLALNGGDAETALTPVADELRALIPGQEPPAAPEAPEPPAAPEAPEPPETPKTSSERTDVRMPGLTVKTETTADGEKASVRMPGVSVDADGEDAVVKIGGMTIEARDSKSEVRVTRERWSEKEGDDIVIDSGDGDVSVDSGFNLNFSSKKRGYRSTFLKSTTNADSPYAAVGYEARGPKDGPLAVAIVKVKGEKKKGRGAEILRDAGALVKRNVGG